MRIAVFGGLYSNYLALESALADAEKRGASRLFCLGDMGAFGPHPDRVFPLLRDHAVECIQGNYDHSIGHGLDDCQCGYTDPRDNHFAAISYRYTYARTSPDNRRWLRDLPPAIRMSLGDLQVLMCHGSPRKTNEFLWESTTSSAFLERLMDRFDCHLMLGTHTGIHWSRQLSGNRQFINVGVLGRPENDGSQRVWYVLLDTEPVQSGKETTNICGPRVEFIPVEFDHARLAFEMEQEGLPKEFSKTILTGWWTTCLEVLPGRERARGKF